MKIHTFFAAILAVLRGHQYIPRPTHIRRVVGEGRGMSGAKKGRGASARSSQVLL